MECRRWYLSAVPGKLEAAGIVEHMRAQNGRIEKLRVISSLFGELNASVSESGSEERTPNDLTPLSVEEHAVIMFNVV